MIYKHTRAGVGHKPNIYNELSFEKFRLELLEMRRGLNSYCTAG